MQYHLPQYTDHLQYIALIQPVQDHQGYETLARLGQILNLASPWLLYSRPSHLCMVCLQHNTSLRMDVMVSGSMLS